MAKPWLSKIGEDIRGVVNIAGSNSISGGIPEHSVAGKPVKFLLSIFGHISKIGNPKALYGWNNQSRLRPL